MNASRPILAAIIVLCTIASGPGQAAKLNLDPLELERSCDNCHDDSSPGGLTGDDWLARMKAMGPIESLTTEQRTEVVGFLRQHGSEVNQILPVTNERYLFEEKCGMCHSVQRTFIEKMDEKQLHNIVMRMRQRAPQWISKNDAKTIIDFVGGGARGVGRPEHGEIIGGPAEVFRGRCAGCHPLERSYLYLETTLEPAWPLLVKRMQLKAPGWISDSEADEIVKYLSGLEPQLR